MDDIPEEKPASDSTGAAPQPEPEARPGLHPVRPEGETRNGKG